MGTGVRNHESKTSSLKAWEYEMRAMALSDTYVKENFIEARRLIAIALEEDPNYPRAWQAKGWIEWQEGFLGSADEFEKYLEPAEEALNKSLELDPDDHSIYSLQSFIHQMRGDDPELVTTSMDKAVADSPGDAEMLALAASAYCYADRLNEALHYYQEAVRRCPICPSWFYICRWVCSTAIGKYRQSN